MTLDISPTRQFKLENCIKRALTWIARDEVEISWVKGEIKWLDENPHAASPEWIAERRTWAEEILASYQEDLRKDKEHLEELQQVLKQIKKPL